MTKTFETKLVSRLAYRFTALRVGLGQRAFGAMDIAGLLDIGEDEAQQMMDFGLFDQRDHQDIRDRGVQLSDMLRWFDRYGAKWFKARLDLRFEELRHAAIEVKKKKRNSVDPAIVKLADGAAKSALAELAA